MIVVNGDSFVHEAHLSDTQKWSNIIGADLNLAIGAGSNDRIFYTTLEFLSHEKCDTLIIGWTSWLRSFMTKSNGSRYSICTGKAFDEYANESGVLEEDNEIAEVYYKKTFNEFTQLKHTLMYMLHLQQYCELKKIRMLNFATVFDETDLSTDELDRIASMALMSRRTKDIARMGMEHNRRVLDSYIAKLDPKKWINGKLFTSMRSILDHYPKTKDWHIGAEGSAHWAGIVKEYL